MHHYLTAVALEVHLLWVYQAWNIAAVVGTPTGPLTCHSSNVLVHVQQQSERQFEVEPNLFTSIKSYDSSKWFLENSCSKQRQHLCIIGVSN